MGLKFKKIVDKKLIKTNYPLFLRGDFFFKKVLTGMIVHIKLCSELNITTVHNETTN